jgi:hypothetical protein
MVIPFIADVMLLHALPKCLRINTDEYLDVMKAVVKS